MNLEERINLQERIHRLEGLLAYAEQTNDEPEIARLRAQTLAGGFAVLRYATNPLYARPYGCMSLRRLSSNAYPPSALSASREAMAIRGATAAVAADGVGGARRARTRTSRGRPVLRPSWSPLRWSLSPSLANLPPLWRNLARKGASRPLCRVSFGSKNGLFCSRFRRCRASSFALGTDL